VVSSEEITFGPEAQKYQSQEEEPMVFMAQVQSSAILHTIIPELVDICKTLLQLLQPSSISIVMLLIKSFLNITSWDSNLPLEHSPSVP
jgi:hypothetical protein